LGVGDSGEPLRSVLLDVIEENLAVYHELNYNNTDGNSNKIDLESEDERNYYLL
jgi:hypothetical protein